MSPHVTKGESSTPGVKLGVARMEYSWPSASLPGMLLMEGESSVVEGVSVPGAAAGVKRVPVLLIAFGGPCTWSSSRIMKAQAQSH